MSRNGPVALLYHALFVIFMLAPIVVVCWVAFTPEGFLSFPTSHWSLQRNGSWPTPKDWFSRE